MEMSIGNKEKIAICLKYRRDSVNKLAGFYELAKMNIPSVPWKEYKRETVFDKDILWTVRTAVYEGNDHNLPRAVGVDYEEAKESGDKFLSDLKDKGIVIYYPYFTAEKSGVIDIRRDKTVIEAVRGDLWNLVTYGKRDVTLIYQNGSNTAYGDGSLLNQNETEELLRYGDIAERYCRDEISQGKAIILEWSYAYLSDINKKPVGERYIVFYELRSV